MADSKFKDIGEGIAGAGLITAALLTPFLRFWHWWDTTDAEVHRSLPGDDLVPHSKGGYTHVITIHAPPAASGRGWCSWDRAGVDSTATNGSRT